MNTFPQDTNLLLDQKRSSLGPALRQRNYKTDYHPSRLMQLLAKSLTAVMHWLTAGNELRISRRTVGNIEVWKVYDPMNNSVHSFTTENDLRSWLEQRYY